MTLPLKAPSPLIPLDGNWSVEIVAHNIKTLSNTLHKRRCVFWYYGYDLFLMYYADASLFTWYAVSDIWGDGRTGWG